MLKEIAKTYNTLAKSFMNTNNYGAGERKLIYKAGNKIYLMNEKDKIYKCLCETDSK